MDSNINIKKSNNKFLHPEIENNHFKPKQRLTIPPPRSWGLQESIILGLILLILLLSIFAATIFFNIFPLKGIIGNTNQTTLSSTSVSSQNNSISKTGSVAVNSTISAKTSSTTNSVSTTTNTITSTSSTKTNISTSTNSTNSTVSTSTVSTSKSSSSAATSSVTVNGNTKIYYPKGDTLGVVGRNFTGTDSTEKLIFSLLERIKGPTAEEQSAGFKKDINFSGVSNCDGNWFEISSPSSTTLQLQFCRPIQLLGSVADGLMEQGIVKSVTDNSEYTKVIILDQNGNCLFNASGQNKCLQ